MHYLVDGYNLLFKGAWSHTSPNLEQARSALIQELDKHASLLNLHLTIVFDAPLQSEELRRGHYNSLEIIFTAKGQTADDYLHDFVAHQQNKVVVVTSDKTLARKVKSLGAYVEGVRDFLSHLRKKSQNRLAKTQKKPLLQRAVPPPPAPIKQSIEAIAPTQQEVLPPLSNIPAWEKIFEEHYHKTFKKPKK